MTARHPSRILPPGRVVTAAALALTLALGSLATFALSGCPDPPCHASCDGKECGSDGCGGMCGSCPGGFCVAEAGVCVCDPDCDLKACGPDGCGGSCGVCPSGFDCVTGQCLCVPDCEGKVCGDDGCWGSCGDCPGAGVCVDDACCYPDCAGRECGSNGCGGQCGTCPVSWTCTADARCQCPADCAGRDCGSDGCGGTCGVCPAGATCMPSGTCCAPDCEGRECGADGCGGLCGACKEYEACFVDASAGKAACVLDALECTGLGEEPTPDEGCEIDADCAAGVCVPLCGWRTCTCAGDADCPGQTPACTVIDPVGGQRACLPECPAEDGTVCPAALPCVDSWVAGAEASVCSPGYHRSCAPCEGDSDCAVVGDRCLDPGETGKTYCLADCAIGADGCGPRESCVELDGSLVCRPEDGVCACEVGAEGICINKDDEGHTCSGALVCEAMKEWVCHAPEPEPEVCDGVDNDCDGLTDHHDPDLVLAPCEQKNEFGACPGMEVCITGAAKPDGLYCDAPEPVAEVCGDEIDDDCDGETDEGCE